MDRSQTQTEAFLLHGELGYRFCVLNRPAEPKQSRGAVLCVPPFAEELNKTRRMTAITARALAREGWTVLQVDLFGCGDSSGEFGDASWEIWANDLHVAYQWLASRYSGPYWLWGIRAGALLATQVLFGVKDSPNLLFWQPVLSGRQHLTQFLRVAIASAVFGRDAERGGVEAMRSELKAGSSLAVAGYEISPRLTDPMDQVELTLPTNFASSVLWLEVSMDDTPSLLPASAQRIAALSRGGRFDVRTAVVQGSLFWQTVETTECRALVSATCNLLDQHSA